MPVAALAAGAVVEVHVVVADEVEDHLGGLGQGHGAQVDPIQHVLQRALAQPDPCRQISQRRIMERLPTVRPD